MGFVLPKKHSATSQLLQKTFSNRADYMSIKKKKKKKCFLMNLYATVTF